MQKRSAGILMYRRISGALEVLLVHPGGPIWAKKDIGSWTIPKGEFLPDEDARAAAVREFQEETGFAAVGDFLDLGIAKQKSGKLVYAWALEGDFDPAELVSNTCEIEWPPRSGRRMEIPEVDRGAWYAMVEAREKILPGQVAFLDALERLLPG